MGLLFVDGLRRNNHWLLYRGYFTSFFTWILLWVAKTCQLDVSRVTCTIFQLLGTSVFSCALLVLLPHLLDHFQVRLGSAISNSIVFCHKFVFLWVVIPCIGNSNFLLRGSGSGSTLSLLTHSVQFVAYSAVMSKYSRNFAMRAVWRVIWECFQLLFQAAMLRWGWEPSDSHHAIHGSCGRLEEWATIFKDYTWIAQPALLADLEKLGVTVWELVELVVVLAIHDHFLRHGISAWIIVRSGTIKLSCHCNLI